MALLEVAVAMPVMMLAFAMLAQILSTGVRLNDVRDESWACANAAQIVLERMRNVGHADIVRMYNADPFDDPGGPGTAPGHLFDVGDLQPVSAEEGARVGEVILPSFNMGSEVSPDWQVREDLELAELGLPRDLNGDAVIDDSDHAGDYTILPVLVRITWQGKQGPREFRVATILTEYR